MKSTNLFLYAVLLFIIIIINKSYAQNSPDTMRKAPFKLMLIIKNDGTEFMGNILSQDAREVLIETKKMGQVMIPKHEIKEIREIKEGEVSGSGEYLPAEIFSTRYFNTTNGFPIKKGESYIQFGLFGGEFQFAAAKNLSLGIMTSWLGIPIIGSAKYSIELGKNIHLGLGTLIGSGSWAFPKLFIALPYGALTFGDRRININFSGGYGAYWYEGSSYSRVLFSVAGMAKVGRKVSLVFDSFIIPSSTYTFTTSGTLRNSSSIDKVNLIVLIPGIRFQTSQNNAFQFGFTGMFVDGKAVPFPIPVIQWYKKL